MLISASELRITNTLVYTTDPTSAAFCVHLVLKLVKIPLEADAFNNVQLDTMTVRKGRPLLIVEKSI